MSGAFSMQWLQFLSGIGTGVFASILCGIALLLWHRVVVPWWQNRGYEGLRLDGCDWKSTIPDKDGKFILVLILSQKFHILTGHLEITKHRNDGEVTCSKLEVQGRYWEQFAQLNCKSVKDGRLSFSTLLLKSKEGGNKLCGKYVFRALNNDEVMASDVEFCRK